MSFFFLPSKPILTCKALYILAKDKKICFNKKKYSISFSIFKLCLVTISKKNRNNWDRNTFDCEARDKNRVLPRFKDNFKPFFYPSKKERYKGGIQNQVNFFSRSVPLNISFLFLLILNMVYRARAHI
jgi:hypothetical protein